MLTHMHMIVYTRWSLHICKGGGVWGVERGLGSSLSLSLKVGFRRFCENKMSILHCARCGFEKVTKSWVDVAGVSIRCWVCIRSVLLRQYNLGLGNRCSDLRVRSLSKNVRHRAPDAGWTLLSIWSTWHGVVVRAEGAPDTRFCLFTRHQMRPVMKILFWSSLSSDQTLGAKSGWCV